MHVHMYYVYMYICENKDDSTINDRLYMSG